MHAHDFKIVYKGNKGIALQCIHCGQPARLRPNMIEHGKLLIFLVHTTSLSCHDVKESLDRIWILVLALLILYVVLPFVYAIVLKNVKCQEKFFENCKR